MDVSKNAIQGIQDKAETRCTSIIICKTNVSGGWFIKKTLHNVIGDGYCLEFHKTDAASSSYKVNANGDSKHTIPIW